jgi:hypothetical protein
MSRAADRLNRSEGLDGCGAARGAAHRPTLDYRYCLGSPEVLADLAVGDANTLRHISGADQG